MVVDNINNCRSNHNTKYNRNKMATLRKIKSNNSISSTIITKIHSKTCISHSRNMKTQTSNKMVINSILTTKDQNRSMRKDTNWMWNVNLKRRLRIASMVKFKLIPSDFANFNSIFFTTTKMDLFLPRKMIERSKTTMNLLSKRSLLVIGTICMKMR